MMTRRRTSSRAVGGWMLACALSLAAAVAQAQRAQAPSAPAMPGVPGGPVHPAGVHWVVDPAAPGEDLPPRGRSLFDFLVTQRHEGTAVQVVPFPFSALIRQVEAQLRNEGQVTGTQAVLIPLGRSLQRNSAAPDFFSYPRAVIVADGQPVSSAQIYVRDRLYLGYQERADVLEVISYNEDAARFEFQVVTDYRAGGAGRVAYANRALCITCHQNGAPIFSRPAWDETNANPRVAALLAAQRRDYYGIAIDRGIDVPNAIDDAVLRANRFAVHQLLWNEGCGGNDEPAARCRAGLFAAALQYRLSGQQFDRGDVAYRDEVAARLLHAVRQRWPAGLAVGNPDLPNRGPVQADAALSAADVLRDWARLVDVGEAFDPLQPRPPLEVWRVAGDEDLARLVRGLAEFIAEPDVRRLDGELFERASGRGAARRTYRGSCRVDAPVETGIGRRIEFRCGSGRAPPEGGLSAEGRLMLEGVAPARGAIDRMEIPGRPALRDIDLEGTTANAWANARANARAGERAGEWVDVRVVEHERRGTAVFSLSRGALRARGADGNALERFELRWTDAAGIATLVVVDDFAPVRDAIAALLRDHAAGRFDGFAAAPFRRARLMPALLAGIGASPGAWCCLGTAGMPPPLAARGATPLPRGAAIDTSGVAESHAPFYRHCGECHLGAERSPPNFLAGDVSVVEAKLRHCAPRIFVRLQMWRREPGRRAKTPMPPEIALHRSGLAAGAWRDGEALAALLQSVDQRLRGEAGRAPSVDALLAEGYEKLRTCLPDDAAAKRPHGPGAAPAAPAGGTS